MQGAHIPVAIAHGEGRAVFKSSPVNIAASYIDNNGRLAIPAKVRKKLHLNIGDKVSSVRNFLSNNFLLNLNPIKISQWVSKHLPNGFLSNNFNQIWRVYDPSWQKENGKRETETER